MRRCFFIISIIAFVFCLLSCENEDKITHGPKVETLTTEQGSYFVVTMSGRVSGLEGVALDFECGFEYSTDAIFSKDSTIRVKIDKNYSDDIYYITVGSIKPNTRYYYRAYYINQELVYYGEVSSFSYKWIAPEISTLDAVLNEDRTLSLKGLIKNISEIVKSYYKYHPYTGSIDNLYNFFGIEYSTSESFDNAYRLKPKYKGDTITCNMSSFQYDCNYYYRSFFQLGDYKSVGEIKSFNFKWATESNYVWDGMQVVDLGLSVKWAAYNIGAQNPWDIGNYYAWGETETKTEYTWASYKYGFSVAGLNSTYLTKYNSKYEFSRNGECDNKSVLEMDDDAASANWGDNWRMPTKEEYEELLDINNCTITGVNHNGVNGYIITSKKAGFTNNSIFLPFTGYVDDEGYYDNKEGGIYWTSSLCEDYPVGAWGLFVNQQSPILSWYAPRCMGLTIRPVCP